MVAPLTLLLTLWVAAETFPDGLILLVQGRSAQPQLRGRILVRVWRADPQIAPGPPQEELFPPGCSVFSDTVAIAFSAVAKPRRVQPQGQRSGSSVSSWLIQ